MYQFFKKEPFKKRDLRMKYTCPFAPLGILLFFTFDLQNLDNRVMPDLSDFEAGDALEEISRKFANVSLEAAYHRGETVERSQVCRVSGHSHNDLKHIISSTSHLTNTRHQRLTFFLSVLLPLNNTIASNVTKTAMVQRHRRFVSCHTDD